MGEPFPDNGAINGAFARRASDRTPGGVARPATSGRAPGASSAAAGEASGARREAEVTAPLDHVPVHPPTADARLPTAARILLGSIAILGAALLGKCLPW